MDGRTGTDVVQHDTELFLVDDVYCMYRAFQFNNIVLEDLRNFFSRVTSKVLLVLTKGLRRDFT